MVAIGLYVRLRLAETPVFPEHLSAASESDPLATCSAPAGRIDHRHVRDALTYTLFTSLRRGTELRTTSDHGRAGLDYAM